METDFMPFFRELKALPFFARISMPIVSYGVGTDWMHVEEH